ncbi:MAG: hypothetical protein CVU90_08585 [Firmicutes bacterium HGW-Firmicutes-15]|nr:MAG: hypothetical protein CVU90_08585 [Firmicutes bacterium HGW-Firmicutes-15]
MKRISIIMLFILGLNLIGGCQTATNNQSNNPTDTNQPAPNPVVVNLPADYYPLTVGSSWEYEGAGNEFASFTRKVLFSKGNMTQTTEDNGGTVATRIIETTDNAVKIVFFAGEDYQPKNLLDTNFTTNDNDIILQAPLKVSTSWAGKDANKSIIAIDALVDTPAGKFDNCIKVKFAGQNDTIYQYFKKGVGMVKQEFISGNTTVTSTLKRYEVK